MARRALVAGEFVLGDRKLAAGGWVGQVEHDEVGHPRASDASPCHNSTTSWATPFGPSARA